tara:strand:+ start:840 stop:1217 length:378 start_codon:yes stop_codon:yes gene_type:complete
VGARDPATKPDSTFVRSGGRLRALREDVNMPAWLFDLLFAFPAKFVASVIVLAIFICSIGLTVFPGLLVFKWICNRAPERTGEGELGRKLAVLAGIVVSFYAGMVLYESRRHVAFYLLESLKSLD